MVYIAYNVVTGEGMSSLSRRSLNKRVKQCGTAGRWVFSRKTIATVAPGFLAMVEKFSREN